MYKNKNFLTFFCSKYFLFTIIIFFGVFFFAQNALAALCQDQGGLCGGAQSGSNRCGEGKFEISQEASNSCGVTQVCCKTGTRPPGGGTPPGPANGGVVSKVTDFIGRGLSGIAQGMAAPFLWVFNILLYAVFVVLGLLLVLGGILLNWAIDPNNFTIVAGNGAVYESWTFVRDIFNIFFIFFLLFAAFATVFQIEKYNYKKIVLHLVIMALLVNFSFPISRFIIDVSNVFFYGIFSLGGFRGGGLSSSMADAFHVAKISIPSTTFFEAGFHASTLSVKLILSNLFLIQVALQFLIIGALFVIRIAVLTILIIFSPVGFVAGIFPGTKQFADQWWSALFNQSFFAPVMALVLVIGLYVMKVMNSQGALQKSIDAAVRANAAAGDYSSLIVGGMTILIPLIIIWVGMISAQKFGAIGADIAMKYKNMGMDWIGNKSWDGVKWGGRTIERNVLGEKYSPRAWIAGWQRRSKEADEDFVNTASGYNRDRLHRWLDKTITKYGDIERDKITAREMKKFEQIGESFDILGPEMMELIGSKTPHAAEKLEALARMTFLHRDQDELLGFIREHLNDTTSPYYQKLKDLGFTNDDTRVNGYNAIHAVRRMIEKTEEGYDTEGVANDLGNIAAGNGGIGFGAVKWDSVAKKFKFVSKEEMAYSAVRKLLTSAEAQKIAQITHRNFATDEYIDPVTGAPDARLNQDWKERLRFMTPADIAQTTRHQPNFYLQVGGDQQISDQAYAFAKEMRDGKAQVYNPKTKKLESFGNPRQAQIAAAAQAVLQQKAGVAKADIIANLQRHGFDYGTDIEPILKSVGSELKGDEVGGGGGTKGTKSGLDAGTFVS